MTDKQLAIVLSQIIGRLCDISAYIDAKCEAEGVFMESVPDPSGRDLDNCLLTDDLANYISQLQDQTDFLEDSKQ